MATGTLDRHFLIDEQSFIPRSCLIFHDEAGVHSGSSATPPSASVLYREHMVYFI